MSSREEPAPAPVAIALRDVIVDHRTGHRELRALDCPRLDVQTGTSVAIMGPSGSGKSTLLGLVAGLALPTRGRVVIGDTVISELGERERAAFRQRAVGMVYQADNLLPHLTAAENIGLALAVCPPDREISGEQTTARVTALLERLGLQGLATRLPDQLSGGQRQRVAVARAIVHRPAVVLADEPTGALDDDSAHAVIQLLIEVQREHGATLALVTHSPTIAAFTDRTVQLVRPSRAHADRAAGRAGVTDVAARGSRC